MKVQKFNESNNDKEVTIIRGDDWSGVYLNGELMIEGHSIDEQSLLEAMGYFVSGKYIDNEEIWEEMGNNCPQKLEDVEALLNSKKYNI